MTNSTARETDPGRPSVGTGVDMGTGTGMGVGLTDEQIVCLIQAVADRRDEMSRLAASEEPGSPERAPFDRETAVASDLHDLLATARAVEVQPVSVPSGLQRPSGPSD